MAEKNEIEEIRECRRILKWKSEEKDKKLEALDKLYEIGNKRAKMVITEVVEATEDDEMLKKCIKILGEIGDKKSIETLDKILESNSKFSIRKEVVESLAKIGGKGVIPPLEKASEGVPYVSDTAKKYLTQIKEEYNNG